MLGNESCDLDSAVSAICFAFFLFKNKKSSALPSIKTGMNVLPILNIRRTELPLKTEVTYLLRKFQVDLENLVCKDEISDEQLVELVLVDHHLSPFRNSVISVVDHRPFDPNSNLREHCDIYMQEVGSCTTLITDIIRKDINLTENQKFLEPLKLLHSTIVLDTINFSKEADKARPLDHEIAGMIEEILKIENVQDYRRNLFDELFKARADVSSLDSLQILSKDLKIISNPSNTVAIPGYPISVQEYIELPEAAKNLRTFAETNNVDVVCLMGMKCTDGLVRRDLGIVNSKNLELYHKVTLRTLLKNCKHFKIISADR